MLIFVVGESTIPKTASESDKVEIQNLGEIW